MAMSQTRTETPVAHASDELGDLDTSLIEGFAGYAARRACLVLVDHFARHMQAHELRPVGFTLLALVGRNPGITSSQLCALLGIHSSNLVTLVKQLQDRALIRRKPHPSDGRALGLHLSVAGRSLLNKALASAVEADRAATARLSPAELQELLRLLRKIYA
jgi:DNA-binding MarR family transcriptional regulator